MIYTTCKYVPEELFTGFGERVERLDPNPDSFSCADGCSHPNLCGFAKAVIEEVNARDIRMLVMTDCCDAMRRTFDVLSRRGMEFLWFLPLPHKTGEAEIRLFAGYLKELKEAFQEKTGKAFSWEAAYQACLANQKRQEQSGPYVAVTGAHGGRMLVEQVREFMSPMEVRDETCSGNRWFSFSDREEVPAAEDTFWIWYAGKLLTGLVPCMRMNFGTQGRRLDKGKACAGIIYHTIKFCDYYSFEYTRSKQEAACPLLKIETDTTPQSSGQLKTRIEAFRETLMAKDLQTEKKTMAKNQKEYVAGIDSGSTSTDVVIMDKEGKIAGSAILSTGMSASLSARKALEQAMEMAGIRAEELAGIVATGYGRDVLDLEKRTITEITCHAKGANYLFPQVRTIIDIGGQDSKVIRIDEEGRVLNFIMNDKCAAGTGRFLETQAKALGLSLEEMSRRGLLWKKEVRISNMCTVFAESEVVSLVAQDTAVEDIIHGLNESVAAKTVSLISRGKGIPAYAMTGGVSRNQGVVDCLEKKLGEKVHISDQSQLCGAIGAALFAREDL